MQITVTVTGLDRVDERLSKLGTSLHDFSEALSILGRQLILFYSETVMNNKGIPLGSRWAPLAASTQAYKEVHWPGTDPLYRTGAMKRSFYANSTRDTLFVSNKAPYFPYHQLGTRRMPQRRVIGVNTTVERMIKTVLQADLKRKIDSTNL
jgi:phage gpG-like protein